MEIRPIAIFRSPVGGKFALPRQAGLAPSLRGRVELLPEYNTSEALRGLDGYDFIWLIWGFHLNRPESRAAMGESAASVAANTVGACSAGSGVAGGAALGNCNADMAGESVGDKMAGETVRRTLRMTVRPPRLGGNERMGVLATRSPYRPNPLGLSSVRIESIDFAAGVIEVSGADLADGTPIYDIKPYIPYADSHPDARGGFTDTVSWQPLSVELSDDVRALLSDADCRSLIELIAQDPRPAYQRNGAGSGRIYRLSFLGRDFAFRVTSTHATVFLPTED